MPSTLVAERLHRLPVGAADERLRGKVEDYFGLGFVQGGLQGRAVGQLADDVAHIRKTKQRPEVRLALRLLGKADDFCAHTMQPCSHAAMLPAMRP